MTATILPILIPALALLTLALLALVSVDVWCAFHTWQARIHIGRWSDRTEWRRSLERRARRWLRRPSVVPIGDGDRWLLWDMLRGRYRSSTVQSWQTAGLVWGLGSEAAAECARRLTDPATGQWRHPPRHPDEALLAWALKIHGALPPAAESQTLEMLTRAAATSPARGTIPYRPHLPHLRFVDTIGMTAPLLAATGHADLVSAQIAEYDPALLSPATPFPAHVWDTARGVPTGIHDWCRGVGWYSLALVGANTHGRLDARIASLATALVRWQRPDGGFGAAIFNVASPTESSGTALAGHLMCEAHRVTGDERFLAAARAAENCLRRATRRNGALDHCQGDTLGPGLYSRRFATMPFAQGAALALARRLDEYAPSHENR